MGNWTKFTIKDDAELKLCGSSPMIDMTYGNYQRLNILDQAHIQISSSGIATNNTGIYSLNKGYQMITISGSENFSSSMVASTSNENDTILTIADTNTFVEGDLISVSNTQKDQKYKFSWPMNHWNNDYLVTDSLGWQGKYFTDVTESIWGGPDPIQIRLDNPNGTFETGTVSGSVMKNEWMLVASSSGADLTVEQLLTDRGWVEEELGQYSYSQFISTFGQIPPDYNGSKTVVLLNSYHKNYKSGDKVIINKKAYTLDFIGTHLKQDILHDFTAGDGTTVDPKDVFVWSPNEISGSFYNQTQLPGNYYSWDEYYRKGTLWDSGSHVTIDGTVVASGSFFLNPNKLRSWGAYGTPYNAIRYDTYLTAAHHLSGSFWLEGEIEISASVSDDPFHNTYQEKRFDEYGSRFNPYAGVGISWPSDPSYRMSSNAVDTTSFDVHRATRADRYSTRFGFDGLYGPYLRTKDNHTGGHFLPFIRGEGNSTISGSQIASYKQLSGYTLYVSMSDQNTTLNSPGLFPPGNITGSGNSFSLKWVREGTNNKYFYKDGKSGEEIKCYEDHVSTVENPSIRVGLQRGARLYKISVKGRYQLAVLNSTDTGFTRLDNVTRAGLNYDKDTSFKAEFLGTQIADPMGYENLLRDWRKKRGKTSQYPYVQGFTYNANNYNSGLGYMNEYYNIGTIFNPSYFGKAASYFSYFWSNANCHYTFDFGTPVTFDTIGLRVNYDGHGEGTRATSQQGAGNSMNNIGIEYTLDHTTNFADSSNVGTFRATAPDSRQSTGRGNPIRFYTGSSQVTAQVIRIQNAGGSRSTSTTDLGFLGVFNGLKGATAKQIKLKSTKHFKVGDQVIFWSNQLGPDGNCTNLGNNQASYYNWFLPSAVSNYNQGDYVTDVEPRTVGGFREEYELVAIDYDTNIVTLDRDPVHQHLEKDTIVFKVNRGNVKLDVSHLGKDRYGCNIRSGYGFYRYLVLHNYHQQGYTYLNGSSGYNSLITSIKNTFHTGRIKGLNGLYLGYDNYKNCFVQNVITSGHFGGFAYGRGGQASKSSIFGVYAAGNGNNSSNLSWNGRKAVVERNFIFLHGGYASNAIFTPTYYGAANGTPMTRNVKIHNTYYSAYYNYHNRYSSHYTGELWRFLPSDSFKNNYSHTYVRGDGTGHGNQTFDNDWYSRQDIIDKRAQNSGLWLYGGRYTYSTDGMQKSMYDYPGLQHMARLRKKDPNFSNKDVVAAGAEAWTNSYSPLQIIKETNNHFKVSANKGDSDVGGYTREGYRRLKYCEFRAEKDCQIKLKTSLDYLYTLDYMMSLDEAYEDNSGYYISNKKYGHARNNGTRRAKIVVLELTDDNLTEQTIYNSTLINNTNNFISHSVDETINLKKGGTYVIEMTFGFGYGRFMNNVIFEYKNPKFLITVENKNDINVLRNTWNLERLFFRPDEAISLKLAGDNGYTDDPSVQVNNLSDPTNIIRVNKIKL